jgi:hypothetical protein
VLCNRKFHDHFHKGRPYVHILSTIYLDHNFSSYSFKIHVIDAQGFQVVFFFEISLSNPGRIYFLSLQIHMFQLFQLFQYPLFEQRYDYNYLRNYELFCKHKHIQKKNNF